MSLTSDQNGPVTIRCFLAWAGNNPWPIGVTSVGIHERSSREKISHVMNGGAHIMNDEATRKYLQVCRPHACHGLPMLTAQAQYCLVSIIACLCTEFSAWLTALGMQPR